MRIRLLAIFGTLLGIVILVAATLTLNTATLQNFRTLDQQARSQDKGVASTSQQPCANPRLVVTAPMRVLLTSETEAITVQVTNLDTVECDITVSLVAPNFTLQPKDNQQLVALATTQSRALVWRVTPTAPGLFTLAFTAGTVNQQLGINVISGNAFFPAQPQTLNYVGIFFGLLLSLASLLAWIVMGQRPPSQKRVKMPPTMRQQEPQAPAAQVANEATNGAGSATPAGDTNR
ncbi:MAG: hypothetical protein ABI068_08195 [Ktedonobacterales bacterium]